MKVQKCYVVFNGDKAGVYNNWPEIFNIVNKNLAHKSYDNTGEAEEAFKNYLGPKYPASDNKRALEETSKRSTMEFLGKLPQIPQKEMNVKMVMPDSPKIIIRKDPHGYP